MHLFTSPPLQRPLSYRGVMTLLVSVLPVHRQEGEQCSAQGRKPYSTYESGSRELLTVLQVGPTVIPTVVNFSLNCSQVLELQYSFILPFTIQTKLLARILQTSIPLKTQISMQFFIFSLTGACQPKKQKKIFEISHGSCFSVLAHTNFTYGSNLGIGCLINRG